MARRRRKPGGEISLFPFLSVLACVIGTLTLIISAVVLGQVGTGETPPQNTHLLDEAKDLLRQSAEKIEENLALKRRLKKQEEKAAELGLSGSPRDLVEALGLQRRIAEQDQEFTRLQDELEEIRENITDMQKRSEGGERAIVRFISPEGSYHGRKKGLDVTHIECKADRLIIHPERDEIMQRDIGGSEFGRIVARIKGQPGQRTLYLLIRPEGVKSFEEAQKVIKRKGVDYGYVPLVHSGEIEFAQHSIAE